MAESALTMAYNELQARVSSYLGWGSGPNYGGSAWSTQQQFELTGLLKSGLRSFYFPMAPDNSIYDWSFLTPQAVLDLPAGQNIVNLPDDFNGFEGPLTLVTTSVTSRPWKLEWRNEGQLRLLYQSQPLETGPPIYAAQVPKKGVSALAGQRFELYVFPTADQEYTLSCRYSILPDYLSGNLPYAYGGAAHSETIYEACLAAAERNLDDIPKGQGPHSLAFSDRLMASIAMDSRHKPQKQGRNIDRSDSMDGYYGSWHYWQEFQVTYDGNSFS